MAVPIVETTSEAKLDFNDITLEITAPSGIVDDDILMCLVVTNQDTAGEHTLTNLGTGATWNNIDDRQHNGRVTIQVWWKRALNESGNYVADWSTDEGCYMYMMRISGVDTAMSAPDAEGVSVGNLTVPNIDPTPVNQADSLVFCFFAADQSAETVDGGFDADYVGITSDDSGGGDSISCSGCIQRRDEATSGADPPNCDWTLTAKKRFAASAFVVFGAAAAERDLFERPYVNISGMI